MAGRNVHIMPAAHDLVTQLRERYPSKAFAFFEQVARGTGWHANRHADAVAMSLWPSRGLELIGFEVKCYRGDWKRELDDPEKADEIAAFMDRWYIVAASDGIVAADELPATWGLLVSDGKKLKCVKEAKSLEPKPLTRHFLAALLRRASENEAGILSAEYERGREAGIANGPDEHQRRMKQKDAEIADLKKEIADFEEASGVELNRWNYGRIGDAVKLIMGDYYRAPEQIVALREGIANTLKRLDQDIATAQKLIDSGIIPPKNK
jgi:hypothetical protein